MDREAHIHSTLLGHKGRCFDVRMNPSNSNQLLTSSEDGYARLWDLERKTSIQALHHNKDAEVLRGAFISPNGIVTAGSDGCVKVWTRTSDQNQGKFCNSGLLDHGGNDCQVYVCEPDKGTLNTSQRLLTGVENRLIVWDLSTCEKLEELQYFDQREEGFGGSQRNPNKHNYVFDAKWHPNEPTQAIIALSDSSLSLFDARVPQVEHVSIDLREDDINLGHPTAVHWSECGEKCYVSYGSGNVVIVDVRKGSSMGVVQLHRTPCYGVTSKDAISVSWSSDGIVRLWEATVDDNEDLDECIIHQTLRLKDFSLLSCCAIPETSYIACAGSFVNEKKNGNAFLGTPVYIVDTKLHESVDS